MRRALLHLKKCDPVLARVITRVGPLKVPQRPATFEYLARSIVFQQLNWKAAMKIYERLLAAAGGQVTPASILALTEEQMRACGLSRQKLSYIRDLAARTQSGEVDFSSLPALGDQEVIATLTRVKGVGVWTAQMFLMFSLGRPDVMPTLDYGIRAAVKRHYNKRKLPNAKALLKLSQPWSPYRTVACWYLWRSLDQKL